ncbi:ATP-grasp domain-containing protein [Anaerococcus murdochii]|uniref:ATP-grasp domain-containing protein n=1 Tax=Anaerococcus murdochii TaxID=411577 RepID=A0ABS7SXR3_9FIRM|nr:ATP-grasp domain-containing protein [Anaerococcus murdochii]MBZ2386328.1 ATP-grasp domain-containing protein [Anaerococcus murdochii]
MTFNAIILGTDHNSYSVARSFNEAFDKKPIVAGSAVLVPFYKSKIADIYTEKNFSSDDGVFVQTLNKIAKSRPEEDFIFFAPTESYVDLLVRNAKDFDFSFHIPYPEKDMAEKLLMKSEFYKILEEIGLSYPRTFLADRENFKDLNLDGELFLKADEYDDFIGSDIKIKQKGYHVKDKAEAIRILENIYDSDYQGHVIVQEFIYGGQGTEYSLNGYRSKDGKVSMVLARNLLSDMRPMWVGNHLVQVDHDDKEMYAIAEKIVASLDYQGLFNFDFKKDAKSGKVYTLEMNIRQGRTFYYSTLAGVNLIKIATEDMILGKSVSERTKRPFMLTAINKNVARDHVDPSLLEEFDDKKRNENSAIHIINSVDDGIMRNLRVKDALKRQEKDLYD